SKSPASRSAFALHGSKHDAWVAVRGAGLFRRAAGAVRYCPTRTPVRRRAHSSKHALTTRVAPASTQSRGLVSTLAPPNCIALGNSTARAAGAYGSAVFDPGGARSRRA